MQNRLDFLLKLKEFCVIVEQCKMFVKKISINELNYSETELLVCFFKYLKTYKIK